jgi:hypothetical protein
MSRVKGGKGYLLVDNRASGGELKEYPTMTCGHANHIVVLNPERQRPRYTCPKCYSYVCDDLACRVECTPIEKCVELAQKYPGLPILGRGKQGELLIDPEILKIGKPY